MTSISYLCFNLTFFLVKRGETLVKRGDFLVKRGEFLVKRW